MMPAPTATDSSNASDRPFWFANESPRLAVALVTIGIAIVGGVLVGITAGPASLNPADAVAAIFSTSDSVARTIVWDIRLPRVAITLMAGAALAVAGLLLQGTTRNPLGDPQLFGIGGGAAIVQALAMAAVITVGLHSLTALSVLASVAVGAMIGLFVARHHAATANLALVGISLAALTAAIAGGILAGSRVFTSQSLFLIGGGTANRGWDDVFAVLPYIAVGLAIAAPVAKSLGALALGDSVARTLGADPVRVRRQALLAAGILGGAAVAVTGLIGFVGLVVPHAARRLVGNDTRALYAVSVPLGAAFVLFADQIARLTISPNEIPIGMITAIVGAPVMIYLARRSS